MKAASTLIVCLTFSGKINFSFHFTSRVAYLKYFKNLDLDLVFFFF